MAQYEEWANSLSEKHRDYVHFLSKGLSPPISTRTMKVVADVMGVPSVIHDDDKIMETAKALAFHHFRLKGEIQPAGAAAAASPPPVAGRLVSRLRRGRWRTGRCPGRVRGRGRLAPDA